MSARSVPSASPSTEANLRWRQRATDLESDDSPAWVLDSRLLRRNDLLSRASLVVVGRRC
jgi:hypothetical protein